MTFTNGNFGAGQTPGAKEAGPTSDIIVPNNSNRNWVFLTNIGEVDVFMAFDKKAEVEKGFYLGANGGSLCLTKDALSTGNINGITKSGQSKIIYQEGL